VREVPARAAVRWRELRLQRKSSWLFSIELRRLAAQRKVDDTAERSDAPFRFGERHFFWSWDLKKHQKAEEFVYHPSHVLSVPLR
jgi:hypothetical protein